MKTFLQYLSDKFSSVSIKVKFELFLIIFIYVNFLDLLKQNKETTKTKDMILMGLWRVMWTGCLGMLCLIPMAWFSFNVLDLGAAITGGLFIGIGDAIDTLATAIPPSWGFLQGFIPFMVQGMLGVIALWYFPLHWALYYRPDEIGMALAIVMPWMLVGTITAALFCKKARQGFDTGLAVGLAYALIVGVFPLILSAILNAALGGAIDVMGVINSLFSGMTDLPYWAAVVTACVEGGLIAGVFGALIGSLKYKPEGQLESQKIKKARKKKKEPKITVAADSTGSSSDSTSGMFCPNCRSKVIPGDPFCPNCGTKL